MCGIAESVNDTSHQLTVFADRGLIFVVRQRWGSAEHDTAVGFLSIQKQRIHKLTRLSQVIPPLPFNRHDCLEDKKENYLNCSVLLCIMIYALTYDQFLKTSVGLILAFCYSGLA